MGPVTDMCPKMSVASAWKKPHKCAPVVRWQLKLNHYQDVVFDVDWQLAECKVKWLGGWGVFLSSSRSGDKRQCLALLQGLAASKPALNKPAS